jgi:hypothetical protein
MPRAFAWIAAFILAAPASAQTLSAQTVAAPQPSEALTARIAELPDILRGGGDYDAYFAPAFRAQVPRTAFEPISKQLASAGGAVTGARIVRLVTPDSARIEIDYTEGVVPAQIAVDPATHQVVELRVTGFVGHESTLDGIQEAIGALPGKTGFAYARLTDGAPDILIGLNADKPFAIGSAFKLVILAELVRATNAGERHWTDTVTLDGKTELPGGTYTQSPAGTQVTLRDLAAKMISISDNSATDILLRTLGRARVEAMLPVVGIANPAALRPFIGTLDMFKLKGVAGLAERYLALNEAGRRRLLAGEVTALPNSAISRDLFKDGKPILIDRIEWFETPADLVRVVDWLRRNTASGAGAEARAILSINPGISPTTAAQWQYVGYKGGSEPGVMNMTLLLESKDGKWFVITGSWNNTEAAVSEVRFAGLMSKAAELAAPKP